MVHHLIDMEETFAKASKVNTNISSSNTIQVYNSVDSISSILCHFLHRISFSFSKINFHSSKVIKKFSFLTISLFNHHTLEILLPQLYSTNVVDHNLSM